MCSQVRRFLQSVKLLPQANSAFPNKATPHFLPTGVKHLSLKAQALCHCVYSILIIIDPFAQLKRLWKALKCLNGLACALRVTELGNTHLPNPAVSDH